MHSPAMMDDDDPSAPDSKNHQSSPDTSDIELPTLVPEQRPSIQNQNIKLSFPLDTSASSSVVADKNTQSESLEDSIVLHLRVDASPGCGGVTWPAGEVLARYLARRGTLHGKKVLEVGSGTGLVALLAGKLGATAWGTDQLPLLATIDRNILLNDLSSRVFSLQLNWGDSLPSLLDNVDLNGDSGNQPPFPQPFDLILAADCVYFEPAFPLLVTTLCALVPPDSTSHPEILFCYKKRRKADKRFFTLLKKHFEWQAVEDDPDRAIYSKEAISLLRLTRKSIR